VGCHLENLRPLLKPNLHLKSSCLKRLWNSNKHSSLVTESKKLLLYNKRVPKAQMWAVTKAITLFKPYGNNLCYELIPLSLIKLSNALITTITITINLQSKTVKMFQVSNGTRALDPFDS
jgi:hypothetical protein